MTMSASAAPESPAHNGPSAAQMLTGRLYKYQKGMTANIPDVASFDAAWKACANLLNSPVTASSAVDAFKAVLEEKHANELTCDAALLSVWGDLLGTQVLQPVHTETGHLKAFRLFTQPRVGIIRQLRNSGLFKKSKALTACGLTTESISDHAIVIFDGPTAVTTQDCMAVTEFKTEKSNCSEISVDAHGRFVKLDLAKNHAPIGQIMVYTAGDLLHSLRRNGIDATVFPLLVLACKLETTPANPSPYCCVRGTFQAPAQIGRFFKYGVEEVVEFTTPGWAETAAKMYIMVMIEGLERAIRITQATEVPHAKPLCGSIFNHKGTTLTMELVGTPIPQPRATNAYQPLAFDMAQGEMFTCNLKGHRDKRTKKAAISNVPAEELRHDEDDETDDVLIKVTCPAVHSYLVSPTISNSAMDVVTKSDSSILEAVLVDHVYHQATNTLATLLYDLRKIGYTDFLPMETGKPTLWSAMTEMAERVLLPMAQLGIVHADIRFGWDRTYNLVSLQTHSGVTLQIIDLESLTGAVIDYPTVAGSFTITDDMSVDHEEQSSQATALLYAWWQIVLAAVVWHHELNQSDVNATDIIDWISTDVQDTIPVPADIQWFDEDFWRELRSLLKRLVTQNATGTMQAATELLTLTTTMFENV